MTLGQRLGVDRREQHPDPAARDDDQGGLLKTALTYGAIHPEAINGGHGQKAGSMEGARTSATPKLACRRCRVPGT
ncbi:hypothetical protein BDA96_08G204300 [Sorghum bicolor]|uniref:Uncharacterized protein n=2 Tax=Sorghum bicolor TaxID=4558 RepID=A0A921QJJ1_SORBI|nr:hypothetical protein BDA96_08G204300 [Sorghum bicolor]KXG24113.1 hypothetical protein SORBI_3008G186700 [Sorghum bicolor]